MPVTNRRNLVQCLVTVGATLVFASGAAAQSSRAIAPVDPGTKSPGTALAWSIGGLTVPIAAALLLRSNDPNDPNDGPTLLGFAGFLIGPSLGHFYAGRTGRGLAGMGGRVVGFAGVAAVVAATWNSSSDDTGVLGVLALGAVAAATVWDIARVPGSVRRHNDAVGRSRSRLAVMPIVAPARLGIGGRIAF